MKIYVIFLEIGKVINEGWGDFAKSSPIVAGSQYIINQEIKGKHII